MKSSSYTFLEIWQINFKDSFIKNTIPQKNEPEIPYTLFH